MRIERGLHDHLEDSRVTLEATQTQTHKELQQLHHTLRAALEDKLAPALN